MAKKSFSFVTLMCLLLLGNGKLYAPIPDWVGQSQKDVNGTPNVSRCDVCGFEGVEENDEALSKSPRAHEKFRERDKLSNISFYVMVTATAVSAVLIANRFLKYPR